MSPDITLTRTEIIDGLTDVVRELATSGHSATIQLVGGAAIALTIDGDRPPTKDIDAAIAPPEPLRATATEVGRKRGWPDGWLDEDAAIFLPSQFGRGAEWVTLHDEGGVLVQAASPRMLLAMKLMAVMKRPLRDADDVAILLAVNEVGSADEAEAVLEEFFPGDNLPPKTYALVQALIEQGARDVNTPPVPDFTSP